MSKAQWLVLGMLLVTLGIELLTQPASRGFFIRLLGTLTPIAQTAGSA